MGFQAALVVKKLPASAGDVRDMGWIPRSGRSPGGGHGNPLQYFGPENPLDRGPCNFSGKNTGVACHFLLQGIFRTKEMNPGLESPALAGGFFTS